MSSNDDSPDFSEEEEENGTEEEQTTTQTESEPTTTEASTGDFDEETQEYLDELVEKGNYDSEQEAIEFAIRYATSEKFG